MSNLESNLDLRASVFPKLRKNTYNGWLRNITLLLTDISLLSSAWILAGNYGTPLNSFWQIATSTKSLFVVIPLEIGLIGSQGLYQAGEKRCDYQGLIKTISLAHILLLIIAFLSRPGEFVSRSTYILSWLFSIFFVCAGRFGVDLLLKRIRKRGAIRNNTILICPPEENEKATKVLESQDCYKNIKCVDTSVLDKSNVKILIEACYFLGISEVFVSSWSSVKDRMFLYWSLRNAGITLRILCIELGTFYRKSEISMLGGVPSIKFSPPLITGSDFWVKRAFDFVVSVSLILLLSPLLLAIAVIIKLDSPGPIVYKQQRVGLNDKRFKALKFRTMVINADKLQKELEARNETNDGVLFKMKNDPRITKIGGFLRRYSLDELPQLFNVLFGEMSLVGPRPLPVRDVEKFSEHHFIRHKVLPGITGLWQVSGRSDILDFEQVVRLDTFYIENWSLLLDVQILLRTVLVILQKKGAY